MPFDGANFARSWRSRLEAAMSAAGLDTIAPTYLDAYKADQIRRHPPGWTYRHMQTLRLGQVIVLVVGIVPFLTLSYVEYPPWSLGIGLVAALVLFLAPMFSPAKGPAEWRERLTDDLDNVHPVIRDRALRLMDKLPDVRFRIGELYQDRINLDPYLIAEYHGVQVLLGIWDDDGVIAAA